MSNTKYKVAITHPHSGATRISHEMTESQAKMTAIILNKKNDGNHVIEVIKATNQDLH